MLSVVLLVVFSSLISAGGNSEASHGDTTVSTLSPPTLSVLPLPTSFSKDTLHSSSDHDNSIPHSSDSRLITTIKPGANNYLSSPLLSYSFNGTGCNQESPIFIDMQSTDSFTIYYGDAYQVSELGWSIEGLMDSWRKCQIHIQLEAMSDHQFSLNSVIHRGHAQLTRETSLAFQSFSFSFLNHSHVINNTWLKNTVTTSFNGPTLASNYVIQQELSHAESYSSKLGSNYDQGQLWSMCPVTHHGSSPLPRKPPRPEAKDLFLCSSLQITDMSLALRPVKQGNSASTSNADRILGPLSQTFFLSWRKCKSVYEV